MKKLFVLFIITFSLAFSARWLPVNTITDKTGSNILNVDSSGRIGVSIAPIDSFYGTNATFLTGTTNNIPFTNVLRIGSTMLISVDTTISNCGISVMANGCGLICLKTQEVFTIDGIYLTNLSIINTSGVSAAIRVSIGGLK